jgi:L-serine dehydratase
MGVSWSVFDVIGPIMVGPSSSHTAGACRIGFMGQAINGEFKKVDIYLHGSFAEVYEGHCTDVAIVAGVLKMDSHDKRLKDSFQIANDLGIEFKIIPTDLGDDLHPNTVKLVFDDKEETAVTGASLGGGKAIINFIGKIPVSISLEHSTLLIHFGDKIKPNEVIEAVQSSGKSIVNISTGNYKSNNLMVIEVKEWFESEELARFQAIEGVNWVKFINHISNFVNLD